MLFSDYERKNAMDMKVFSFNATDVRACVCNFIRKFRTYMKHNTSEIVAYVLAAVAVCLIVGGFFVPPVGVIDGSVLQGVGEIDLIIAIFKFCDAWRESSRSKFKRGDIEIEVER